MDLRISGLLDRRTYGVCDTHTADRRKIMATSEVQVPVDGQLHGGVRVGFQVTTEPCTRAELDDGSVIRLKSVIVDVVRIPGKYDSEGMPLYVVKSTGVLAVEGAEHLHKDSQTSSEGIQ